MERVDSRRGPQCLAASAPLLALLASATLRPYPHEILPIPSVGFLFFELLGSAGLR